MTDVLLLQQRRKLEPARTFAQRCFDAGLRTQVLTTNRDWFTSEGVWSPGPNVHNVTDLFDRQSWPQRRRPLVNSARRWRQSRRPGPPGRLQRAVGELGLRTATELDPYLRPRTFASAADAWARLRQGEAFDWIIALDNDSVAATVPLSRRFPGAGRLLVRHSEAYGRVLASLVQV